MSNNTCFKHHYHYTNELNHLLLIALLKGHNIKNVIVSPGTTNVSFVSSIQTDPFFNIYSAYDERSAAFMACGLAEETKEPVVLSCTGATASRNYIPGLTEAYYKHLPIIAITSSQHFGRKKCYTPQFINRESCFLDAIKTSIQLSSVYSLEDKQRAILYINDIILEATRKNNYGPVHINLATTYSHNYSVKRLPSVRIIKRYYENDNFPQIKSKKIAVFVGNHPVFDKKTQETIDAFCKKYDAIVLCDQTSNFRGKYRILAPILNSQSKTMPSSNFDLIIHIGYISGAYIKLSAKEVWRIHPDGELRDTFSKLTTVFEMDEYTFFNKYTIDSNNFSNHLLLDLCNDKIKQIKTKIKELPFSNIWIASILSKELPHNSILHLSILNSLRSWNFFETHNTIQCYSNTGGFGIDGCLSSLVGSALVNTAVEHFGIIGDLSLFYDINCFFNRVPNNVHILLVNNGIGTEFKNFNHRCADFKEDANLYMAAYGHNGIKSQSLIRNYAINNGFIYLTANNKREFLSIKDEWLQKHDKPILLEVFTNDTDESEALKKITRICIDKTKDFKIKIRKTVAKVINYVGK